MQSQRKDLTYLHLLKYFIITFYCMKRKNRSIKISHMSLLPAFNRRFTAHPGLFSKEEHGLNVAVIWSIIEEMADEAVEQSSFNSVAFNHYKSISGLALQAQQSYHQLQNFAEQEDNLCICERQPQQGVHLFGKNNDIFIAKSTAMQKVSSFRSKGSIKSKSKSCDIIEIEEQKNLQSRKNRQQTITTDRSNRLLPLFDRNRQSNDNSEQIQELMRRKKLLQIQPQPEERLNTQLSKMSKRSHTDRKEKKYYFQDDDGKAQEISCNLKPKEWRSTCFGEVRALPGQNLVQGLKKRAIVEHIAISKRKKRRKDIELGDTCVLIQQIKQTQYMQNESPLKVQSFLRKGVRLIRNSSIEASPKQFKLPAVR